MGFSECSIYSDRTMEYRTMSISFLRGTEFHWNKKGKSILMI